MYMNSPKPTEPEPKPKGSKESLIITTANLDESDLDKIDTLIDFDEGLYPSRSEVIRVAVISKIRRLFLKELKYEAFKEEMSDPDLIRVPILETLDGKQHVIGYSHIKKVGEA